MSIATTNHSQAHEITLRLSDELYETARDAVTLGLAATQSAFIEDAIRLRAREVRHARLNQLAAEAMADSKFVADLHETMRDFQHVDQENWPELMDQSAVSDEAAP